MGRWHDGWMGSLGQVEGGGVGRRVSALLDCEGGRACFRFVARPFLEGAGAEAAVQGVFRQESPANAAVAEWLGKHLEARSSETRRRASSCLCAFTHVYVCTDVCMDVHMAVCASVYG